MVTITFSDDDAKSWLKSLREIDERLGPAPSECPTGRFKSALECALLECRCGEREVPE